MKKLIVVLLICLLLSAPAVAESAHEYVESLGYQFYNVEPDQGQSPHCILSESSDAQSIAFNEGGNTYMLIAFTSMQASFDPADFYQLFLDLLSRYDWSMSFYWPQYTREQQDKATISYGIVDDLDKTMYNTNDYDEYIQKLTVAFGLAEDVEATAAASDPAHIDLSSMSYYELLQLRADVDAALWASDGWQEVEVPSGVYIIGEDIPEGRWTIKCNGKYGGGYTLYPDKAAYNENGLGYIAMRFMNAGDIENVILDKGQYLELASSTYTFIPYTGSALGFK